MNIKDINNLSIIELKQLLAQVNHDLKMNKPTIKRSERIKPAIITENEFIVANKIAANYTGNKQVNPSDNDKLKADIQIQSDILDYLNNGGMIITAKSRKSKKFNSVLSYSNNKIISL